MKLSILPFKYDLNKQFLIKQFAGRTIRCLDTTLKGVLIYSIIEWFAQCYYFNSGIIYSLTLY